MRDARKHRLPPVEDIYQGLADDEEVVPSYRRATEPVLRAKHIAPPPTPVPQGADRESLKTIARREIEKSELTAAAIKNGDAVPEQSMRRIKVARRVVGVPEVIEERLSESVFRDPRRD